MLTAHSDKPVSQLWAVTKNKKFWQATGQLNLAYKRLAETKACKVWFPYSHNCTLTSGAVFHSVCQVWLFSGPPEFFTFSYCAWLWNWLVEQSSILSAKFDCPAAHQNCSRLATAHDCETGLLNSRDVSVDRFKTGFYQFLSESNKLHRNSLNYISMKTKLLTRWTQENVLFGFKKCCRQEDVRVHYWERCLRRVKQTDTPW